MNAGEWPVRRIDITLHKPWFALYAGVKPTLVIEGRGQPVQWGLGTWQLPSDRTVTIGVFLFNRLWRFGQAEFAPSPTMPRRSSIGRRRSPSSVVGSVRASLVRSRFVRVLQPQGRQRAMRVDMSREVGDIRGK